MVTAISGRLILTAHMPTPDRFAVPMWVLHGMAGNLPAANDNRKVKSAG